MVRLLASLVRIPVIWFSTNSITGGGRRFSGEGAGKKEKGDPPEKRPGPVVEKREKEIALLDELIAGLNKEIAELTDSRNIVKKLLDRLKRGGVR